jgi:hypothetical protein
MRRCRAPGPPSDPVSYRVAIIKPQLTCIALKKRASNRLVFVWGNPHHLIPISNACKGEGPCLHGGCKQHRHPNFL